MLTATKPKIEPSLLAEAEEKGQIIIHYTITENCKVSVGRNILLTDPETGIQAKLLHAINIAFNPEWKSLDDSNPRWTLIFDSLPKSCKSFHIPERYTAAGVSTKWDKKVNRNRVDVYHLFLFPIS